MLRLPPLSEWLDTTGTSIQEDEFFLRKEKYSKLYALPVRRKPPGEAKNNVDEEKHKKFAEPVEQLSPKGIALLLHILAEKKGESQPLIVTTIADFKHLIKLIDASPPGTQVTVILQPTEGAMLFPAVHKTVLKIEKTDSKLNVIQMDSTNNEHYFGSCELWIKQAAEMKDIDFYRPQDFEDPRGYGFHAIELDLSGSEQEILDYLKSRKIPEYQMPVLVKEGENIWLYGFKMNKNGVAEQALMKFSNPGLFEIFFPTYVKEVGGIPKEIYNEAAKLGLYVPKKHPYSRQADFHQCGIFAIKDARQLHRDRDFLSKITPFEDVFRTQPEEKGHYYRFNTPPGYLKGVQSSAFRGRAIDRYSDAVVTRKGKTLQETYDKHNLEDGYLAHFSKKYHSQVERFLAEHKDNPAFIRQCVEAYDAGKMTLSNLVAIYGPQKKREVVSDSNTSTTIILSRGVGVMVSEEKKLGNKVVPGIGLDAESTTSSFAEEDESLKDDAFSPAEEDESLKDDNDKINNAGQSQVFRK